MDTVSTWFTFKLHLQRSMFVHVHCWISLVIFLAVFLVPMVWAWAVLGSLGGVCNLLPLVGKRQCFESTTGFTGCTSITQRKQAEAPNQERYASHAPKLPQTKQDINGSWHPAPVY